jgi:hypothetical protein
MKSSVEKINVGLKRRQLDGQDNVKAKPMHCRRALRTEQAPMLTYGRS